MNNVFKSLKPDADLSRNAFAPSKRDVFSIKTGMITPCLTIDTLPDSLYNVNVVDIVRTDSIQSAPFARMSQNIEYFFVPYTQLYRDFERLYYERGDNQRNVGNVPSSSQSSHVPEFSIYNLVDVLYKAYCLHRLRLEIKSTLSSPQDWENWYERQSWFDTIQIDSIMGFADCYDIHGRVAVEDILRNLDMLGYGNFLPAFKGLYVLAENGWSSSVKTDFFLSTTTEAAWQSIVGYDLQVYENDIYFTSFLNQFSNRYLSVLRIAAYLKVWSDYFRNSQYDVNINYAYYFNFDYAVTDSLAIVPTDKVVFALLPRYRQYKKDIFTGGFPTAQFGSVAVAMTENPVEITSAGSLVPGGTSGYASVGSDSSLYPGQIYASNQVVSNNRNKWNIDSSVSALSIRQALALQRYKERILRAGNRSTALQKAVFGDNSRYLLDEYADFIGAVHSTIDFNSVPSTSDSGTFNVGELASNGVSTHGGPAFEYKSHDFGLILGVMYVLPESEYESYGVDRFNTMTESFDFFKPDLQNLGLAPVFNFDFNYMSNILGNNFVPDSVLNYLARYWQYKTNVDKVHGEFYGSLPFDVSMLSQISSQSQLPASYDDLLGVSVGAFSDYVTPRNSQVFRAANLKALYVNPNDVDRIFYTSTDETQASDKFKVNMSHEIKSVLPMSVIGLPL